MADAGVADFTGEAERLRWAARYVAVPQVLGSGVDGHCAWLRTGGLPGLSAVRRGRSVGRPGGGDAVLGWNSPGRVWEAEFFAAYGVEPDRARIDYYRRLWHAEDVASR